MWSELNDRLSEDPRWPEVPNDDPLLRHADVRMLGVVGRDQLRHVDQVGGRGRLAGAVGRRHRVPPRTVAERQTLPTRSGRTLRLEPQRTPGRPPWPWDSSTGSTGPRSGPTRRRRRSRRRSGRRTRSGAGAGCCRPAGTPSWSGSASLEDARAVLERARALIAQGWVQDAFYVVRGRNGERRPVSPFGLLLLTRTDVVGACLVGAVAHASGSVDRRARRGQAALAVDTLWHALAEDPSYEPAADGALRRGAPGRPRGQGPRAGPVERRAGPHPRRGARADRPGGVPDDPGRRPVDPPWPGTSSRGLALVLTVESDQTPPQRLTHLPPLL